MTRLNMTKCIERDYWRISLADSLVTGDPHTLGIQGRRRNSEAFWPAFELPIAEFERLLETVSNAVVLAEGYRWTGGFAMPPSFPNTDTLALCQGPFYLLDLSESLGGNLQPTIMMTLLTCDIPARPVLHLIDEELPKFLSDLQEMGQFLSECLGPGSNGKPCYPITNDHLPGDESLG